MDAFADLDHILDIDDFNLGYVGLVPDGMSDPRTDTTSGAQQPLESNSAIGYVVGELQA
jgi:hypothetical protein